MRRIIFLLFVLLFACDRQPESVLDRGPRIPDHEGVVTEIDFQNVVLDGKTKLPISQEVESFTAAQHKVTAIVHWKSWYVHVGRNGDGEAAWISGLSLAPPDTKTVQFPTTYLRIEDGRLVMKDGTTLKAAEGVKPVGRNSMVIVTIDVEKDLAVAMEEQG